MSTDLDLHYLDLCRIGKLVQTRAVSSMDITQALLTRIAALDQHLHSYAYVMTDEALAEACRADEEISKGQVRGPLHGVPLAVKDLIWVAGVPACHGMMMIYRDFIPTEDATVVRRLRAAGAVILGKSQQTEGAFSYHHPSVTPPVNPWDASLWAGVSSSGSGVATAAGLCFGALGTDTGGSIRFPSAANGLTGIKPTWGRVSRYGAFELAASLDHIGPMARSAADAAAILGVIAGADLQDPTAAQTPVPDYLAGMTRGLRGCRIGVDRGWAIGSVDTDTQVVMLEALRTAQELGAVVVDISFPDPTQVVLDWTTLCAVEAAVAHEGIFPERRSAYGSELAALLDIGHEVSALEYQKMWLRRTQFRRRVQALFASLDLLLIPTTAFAAQTVKRITTLGDDAEFLSGMMRYTCPFDLSGHPTITLPGGQTSGGAPVAFQFVAAHFDEQQLIRAGWAYQNVTSWHQRHPWT